MTDSFLDFSGKVVLITGGTRGIGLETGLSFAKRGAQCVLTYNWGDHDEAALGIRIVDFLERDQGFGADHDVIFLTRK